MLRRLLSRRLARRPKARRCDLLDELRAAQEGTRNDTLNRRAYRVGRLCAGSRWATRARKALVELRGATADDEVVAERLLADVYAAFETRGVDRLATTELLALLCDDDEAPWVTWHGPDRRLTPRAFARLLAPFEIHSRTIRLDDATTPKGYLREQFEDAWKRYPPGFGESIRHNATTGSLSQETLNLYPPQTPDVADSKTGANPHGFSDVADVADRNPQPRGLREEEQDIFDVEDLF
jgi:hypothetical protein